jgi:hypothetical protein
MERGVNDGYEKLDSLLTTLEVPNSDTAHA